MKILQLIVILTFATGCDLNREVVDSEEVPEEILEESTVTTGSFRMRNAEIIEEMLAEFEKQNIEYRINDDGSISYLLSDGKIIDTIGNEITLAYTRSN